MNDRRLYTGLLAVILVLLLGIWALSSRPEQPSAPAVAVPTAAPQPELQPSPVPTPAPAPAPEPTPDPEPQPAAPIPFPRTVTRDGPEVVAEEVALEDLDPEIQIGFQTATGFAIHTASSLCVAPWVQERGIDAYDLHMVLEVDEVGLAEVTVSDDFELPDAVHECMREVMWRAPMVPLPTGQFVSTGLTVEVVGALNTKNQDLEFELWKNRNRLTRWLGPNPDPRP